MPIPGLEPLVSHGYPDSVCLETGPEPDWVKVGLELPSKVLSHLPEIQGAPDPSFVLTEHGNAVCFHLDYSDGTRFVVDASSKRVWGTFKPPLTAEDLATYFLGPVMGFLLRQRHWTSLHASCVEIAGCGFALSGEAGFGKSTTAAALALRGFPVVSEDIVPLKQAEGHVKVVPGYPRICLWPDSVVNLMGAPDALPRLTPVWDKRYLALDGERAEFCSRELPLGAIYLFAARTTEQRAPYLERLTPREALLNLVQNTYMNWLLDREQRAVEFDFLARLVSHVPVSRIIPHADAKKIGELCSLIVSDAQSIVKNDVTNIRP
ncbi:MAG: hypothetical protein WAK20_15600 [Candidatus Acidiferrum sp.]